MERNTVYLGMDVHKDTITLAAYVESEPTPRFQKTIANESAAIRKHLKKIEELGTISCCYEAGFCGYSLYHFIDSLGYKCRVIAPSLIPKRAGDKVKNDRRDAKKLATLLRADLLTSVSVPSPETEEVRAYIRLRYQIKADLTRTRQRILKFLQTLGLVFRGTKQNWTVAHRDWLSALNLEGENQLVLSEHLAVMAYLEIRLKDIDQRIEQIAARDEYRASVGALSCLKGISTFSAMVLLTEIGDFRRFSHPRQLMSYIGLTPREDSSGPSEHKGRITKCGSSRLRHVLVEAARQYRNKPTTSRYLAKKYEGQPKEAILYATNAMHRLYKRYWRLAARKNTNVAIVAIARELTGFIWGMMRLEFSN